LRCVCGLHKVIQVKVANVATNENPELLIVQNIEIVLGSNEQVVAIGVKGADFEALQIKVAQLAAHAIDHFGSGVVGVGESEYFVRAGMAFANEPGDALN